MSLLATISLIPSQHASLISEAKQTGNDMKRGARLSSHYWVFIYRQLVNLPGIIRRRLCTLSVVQWRQNKRRKQRPLWSQNLTGHRYQCNTTAEQVRMHRTFFPNSACVLFWFCFVFLRVRRCISIIRAAALTPLLRNSVCVRVCNGTGSECWQLAGGNVGEQTRIRLPCDVWCWFLPTIAKLLGSYPSVKGSVLVKVAQYAKHSFYHDVMC